jgi:hypothetical protein
MRPEALEAVCEGAVRFDPSGGMDVFEEECRRWCVGLKRRLCDVSKRRFCAASNSRLCDVERSRLCDVESGRAVHSTIARERNAGLVVHVDRTARPKEPENISTA